MSIPISFFIKGFSFGRFCFVLLALLVAIAMLLDIVIFIPVVLFGKTKWVPVKMAFVAKARVVVLSTFGKLR